MIRTHGLRKTFGTLDAVQGLDLHVKEGSATALVGANGAGKSTTIRVIMNLLPSRIPATPSCLGRTRASCRRRNCSASAMWRSRRNCPPQ